ncbi:hypothetical protein MAPG_12105 [Magnaporthiopsis poae ATCC 64411]|uniref:Uncharacterized protein n=1 Tax=Magnaporthiopsis poae (strain ATCC 64411 / 73-15) TaxID=644358 RepID=A0A0C4EGU9_MAGP6|nr:hypothetical protein MAPG_12105 [Magnaporthiopsis poae ATCC 64411]
MAAKDGSTSTTPASTSTSLPHNDGNADFYRLCLNGTGHFRTILMQAFFVGVVELEQRTHERGSGGGDDDDDDDDDDETAQIHAMTAASRAWTARRALAGETNAQGIAFSDCLTAYHRAVASGCGEEAVSAALASALTASVTAVHSLLVDLTEFEERANRQYNSGRNRSSDGDGDGDGEMAPPLAAVPAIAAPMQGQQQQQSQTTGLGAEAFDMATGGGGGLGLGLDAVGGSFVTPPHMMTGFSDLDMLQGFEDTLFGSWNWEDSMDMNPGFGMEF